MEIPVLSERNFYFQTKTNVVQRIERLARITADTPQFVLAHGKYASLETNVDVPCISGKRVSLGQWFRKAMELRLCYEFAPRNTRAVIKLFADDITYGENIFKQLGDIFGGLDRYTLDVSLKLGTIAETYSLALKETHVEPLITTTQRKQVIGVTFGFYIPSDLGLNWCDDPTFSGKISLKVKVNESVLAKFFLGKANCLLSINKKMLENGVDADVSIVAQNGAQIRCHKTILSMHSPVLRALLQNSSIFEMTNLSEASVRAFLAYLYFGDVTQAIKSSNTAFDMLLTAELYQISKFEEMMMDLFVVKPNSWFHVSITQQLLEFVKSKISHDATGKYKMLGEKLMSVLNP